MSLSIFQNNKIALDQILGMIALKKKCAFNYHFPAVMLNSFTLNAIALTCASTFCAYFTEY
jgi:hypothetical protein